MINLWRAAVVLGAALAFCPYWGSHEPRWAFCILGAATGLALWRRLTLPDCLGLALIGWSALSLLWSSDPSEGLTTLVGLVALFGVFLLFEQGPAVRGLGITATIATAGAVALGFALPDLDGGFFNQNFITEFLVIAGIAAFIKGGTPGILAGGVAFVWVVFINHSFAWGAALASLIVMGCIALRWYWAAFFLTLGKINAVVFLLPYMGQDIADSFRSRFELWFNSLSLWLEAPVWGLGLGSYNHEYSRIAQNHLAIMDRVQFQNVFLYPGSAHNDALSTLVELGLVGFLLAGGFCLAVLRIKSQEMEWTRWPLAAAAGICMVAFPLLVPSTAVLVAALIGLASRPDSLQQPWASASSSRAGTASRPIWRTTRLGSLSTSILSRRFGPM